MEKKVDSMEKVRPPDREAIQAHSAVLAASLALLHRPSSLSTSLQRGRSDGAKRSPPNAKRSPPKTSKEWVQKKKWIQKKEMDSEAFQGPQGNLCTTLPLFLTCTASHEAASRTPYLDVCVAPIHRNHTTAVHRNFP